MSLSAAQTMASGLPAVRVFQASEWRSYRALRLQALADSPDAFGSTLAAESMLTDEDWAARLARGTAPGADVGLVAEVSGHAAGLAWAKVDTKDESVANLYQMWVSPSYRGRGVGRMLLSTAIEWARNRGAQAMVLCVTCGDTPAMRLYTRAGFTPAGLPEPLRPGSEVLAQTLRLTLIHDAD